MQQNLPFIKLFGTKDWAMSETKMTYRGDPILGLN